MSMKEEQLRLVMDQESKIYLWNYIKYLGTYNIFIYSYASCTIIFVIFCYFFGIFDDYSKFHAISIFDIIQFSKKIIIALVA